MMPPENAQQVDVVQESATTVFTVGMTCDGCAAAVRRILNKQPGVENIDIDVHDQRVTVKHTPAGDKNAMLAALRVWGDASGKRVEFAAA